MNKKVVFGLVGMFFLSYSVTCKADKTQFQVADNSYNDVATSTQSSNDMWEHTLKPTASSGESAEWTAASSVTPSRVTFPAGAKFVYAVIKPIANGVEKIPFVSYPVPKSGTIKVWGFSSGYGSWNLYVTPTSL